MPRDPLSAAAHAAVAAALRGEDQSTSGQPAPKPRRRVRPTTLKEAVEATYTLDRQVRETEAMMRANAERKRREAERARAVKDGLPAGPVPIDQAQAAAEAKRQELTQPPPRAGR